MNLKRVRRELNPGPPDLSAGICGIKVRCSVLTELRTHHPLSSLEDLNMLISVSIDDQLEFPEDSVSICCLCRPR